MDQANPNDPTIDEAASDSDAFAKPSEAITYADLAAALSKGSVLELTIEACGPAQYRLVATLDDLRRLALLGSRGQARVYRTLDTVVALVMTLNPGDTLVRLDLRT